MTEEKEEASRRATQATEESLLQKRQQLQLQLAEQAAAALLKSYAGLASQHNLQLDLATEAEVQRYDNLLVGCWETLAERPFTEEAKVRLGLPAPI